MGSLRSRSERHHQALQRSRACSKSKTPAGSVFFEEPGRSRSSALLEPSGSCSHCERPSGASSLDRPFRPLQRSQKRWQVHCLRTARPPWRRRASSVQRSRGGVQRSRGGSGCHFERPSNPKLSNVGRCCVFVARPSQLIELIKAWNVEAVNIYSVEVCVHVSVAVSLKFFIAQVSLALPYRFCFG